MQSETIAALAAALSKCQAAMDGAKKDAVNPAFRNKYATLAAIMEAIHEPMAANGLAVVQLPMPGEKGELRMRTQLLHTSGEWIASEIAMPLAKVDPQGYGSALTYARRYALAAMLGVVQEDDDGNAASRPGGGGGQATAPAGWSPSEAQVKRAYALGAAAGLERAEVDTVTKKYCDAESPAKLTSKAAYDELTADGGLLQAAGKTKRDWKARQAQQDQQEDDIA